MINYVSIKQNLHRNIKQNSVCAFNNILDSPVCDGEVNFLFTFLQVLYLS